MVRLKQYFKFSIGKIVLGFALSLSGFGQTVPLCPNDVLAQSTQSYLLNPLKFGTPAILYQIPCNENKNQPESNPELREDIISYAMNFLGIRYRSSGKSPKIGFDCSGFTGYIYRNFGFKLKASSPAQAMEGKKVPLEQARKGDLAFFGKKNRKGKVFVNHAAIVISKPGEPLAIIHSASNKGIVITRVNESRYWRNSLLFVRNVL